MTFIKFVPCNSHIYTDLTVKQHATTIKQCTATPSSRLHMLAMPMPERIGLPQLCLATYGSDLAKKGQQVMLKAE